jgi:predicted DNA binding CopG/RHH family protein
MEKLIPDFFDEDMEREFWDDHDSVDYLDWNQAKLVIFPSLKPSTKTISLRLPESMLDQIRAIANKRDVSYQSLIKMFLQDRIDEENRIKPL